MVYLKPRHTEEKAWKHQWMNILKCNGHGLSQGKTTENNYVFYLFYQKEIQDTDLIKHGYV